MSGLLGLLDLGSNAYQAFGAGTATTGRNLANLETVGYSRERIDLRAELAAPRVGGVHADGPVRVESELLSMRERAIAGGFGRSDALASALLDADARLAPAGAPDIVDGIAGLFAGFAAVASAPLDDAMRRGVIGDADSLATSFRRAAQTVQEARSGADQRIRGLAGEASMLSSQIAAANRAMATSNDPVLADRRDLAARRLSELTGATARIDPGGMMQVTMEGGISVVDGIRASSFEVTTDATLGNFGRIDVVDGTHRDDVTAIAGGQLGGEVAARDVVLARSAAELDQLAFDVATEVNAVHRAGAGLDGIAGRDLFDEPAAVTGAAAAMRVDAGVVADPDQLAGAIAGAPVGDNRSFLALAGLVDQALAGGGQRSFLSEAVRTLSTLGADAQRAGTARELDAARVDVEAGARDALSGVSTEEEMTRLGEFQRATQAATRFIATVDDMLRDLIERI